MQFDEVVPVMAWFFFGCESCVEHPSRPQKPGSLTVALFPGLYNIFNAQRANEDALILSDYLFVANVTLNLMLFR